MGYNTQFKGTLLFTTELTIPMLKSLEYLLDDNRPRTIGVPSYIDLKINKEYSGLIWDGSEKTYQMIEAINYIISEMKNVYPEFGLKGFLEAHGEEVGDTWIVDIDSDGYAQKLIERKPEEAVEYLGSALERLNNNDMEAAKIDIQYAIDLLKKGS